MKVNKLGVDWTILRAEITERIEGCMTSLMEMQPEADANHTRGRITALRGIIAFVEDPDPPKIEEDNYVD